MPKPATITAAAAASSAAALRRRRRAARSITCAGSAPAVSSRDRPASTRSSRLPTSAGMGSS
ncbi:MAG TPA: hypothetical protein DEQ43_17640 [Nocardioides bacterium]|uniref:MYXO-CTERM sorting domain-containing protein n=1 Tax=uncultured Nocardioides sp. TaxID=198441 RepID=UPI000EC63EE7|nr:hypothetical protein [Nocardioides sp.]